MILPFPVTHWIRFYEQVIWRLFKIYCTRTTKFKELCNNINAHINPGATSLYTLILELVRMITYRVSISEWKIHYCHVAPRHIFTSHSHGLPQICKLQVWHTKENPISVTVFCSTTWQHFWVLIDLWYICVIYVWIWVEVSNPTV